MPLSMCRLECNIFKQEVLADITHGDRSRGSEVSWESLDFSSKLMVVGEIAD